MGVVSGKRSGFCLVMENCLGKDSGKFVVVLWCRCCVPASTSRQAQSTVLMVIIKNEKNKVVFYCYHSIHSNYCSLIQG